MLIVKEILKATKGILLKGSEGIKVTSVSTDTRTLKKGALFIALKGQNFDGHRFISQALRKGARAVLISQKQKILPKSSAVLYVNDTTRALGELAHYHRCRFDIPILAITGSAGKTTTKEMIAVVLSKKYRVLKNYSTENNVIGVSKTLFKLNKKHTIAILELGTNHFGEIKRLTQIVDPSTAIMLNIGKSHLEFLKNTQGVFQEKSAIYKNMKKPGTVIFNKDDPKLCLIEKQKIPHKKISFAVTSSANIRATHVKIENGWIEFLVGRHRYLIPGWSCASVYNALAAITCGQMLGVNIKHIQSALRTSSSLSGRQRIYKRNGLWIMDDTYNANPLSVQTALESFKVLPCKGKKIFVFGDMKELGSIAKQEHAQISRYVKRSGVDIMITVGKLARYCAVQIKAPNTQTFSFLSNGQARDCLQRVLKKGDAVLFKGSRAMRLENILKDIFSSHPQ